MIRAAQALISQQAPRSKAFRVPACCCGRKYSLSTGQEKVSHGIRGHRSCLKCKDIWIA